MTGREQAGDMHFPTLAVCANCGGGRCQYAPERVCNEAVGMAVGSGYFRCGQVAAWIVRATSGLQEPRCWRHGVVYSEDRRTPIPLSATASESGGAS